MSKLQSNAVPLKSSSEVIISQNNSEFSNSLQDVVRSGGSINIVGSMTESISSSINHSLNKSLLQMKKELKDNLISEFSKLNICINNEDFTFYSIEEISRKEIWKDKIYRIRRMKKDKNNLIRSIAFCFLENIILNNDVISLKEFIFKFNEISGLENKEKTKHILLIILDYLEQEKNVMEAYNILLKSFLYIDKFDFNIIFFVRKWIYNYIAINQNNSLNDEEPKKISESLPEKYDQDKNGNIQLLDNFYKDLMNMEYELPYNEIYSKVIPYIFKYDLSIIEYKKEYNTKEIKYKYKENNNSCLNLIYLEKEKYLNVYYTKDFYEKSKIYFKVMGNKSCIKCRGLYNSEKNKYKICDKCLLEEISHNIYNYYLNFRINYKSRDLTKNNTKKIINIISKKPFQSDYIKEKNISLGEIIVLNGFDILQLVQKTIQNSCLVCIMELDLKNNNGIFSLPCKCNFCSLVCFEKYIESIKKKNNEVLYDDEKVILPMHECYCGYSYKLKDFNELKKLLERANKKDDIYIINEAIDNNLIWKCIFCKKNFNKKDHFLNLQIKDVKDHLLCENCGILINININEEKNTNDLIEIFCEFCGTNHKIESWKIAKGDECIIL